MKNLLLPILLFSFLFAEGNKVNLKIDGMKCAYSCAGKVSEVVVGARTPIIIARACEGSIVKTKGKTSAKPDVPPIPGSIPTIKPSNVPANRNAK